MNWDTTVDLVTKIGLSGLSLIPWNHKSTISTIIHILVHTLLPNICTLHTNGGWRQLYSFQNDVSNFFGSKKKKGTEI